MYKCYLITNTINQKKYIGCTSNTIGKRWSQHKYDAKRGSMILLHRAIRKYGAEAFVIECVADNMDMETARTTERSLVVDHNSHYTRGHGYNMTTGGESRKPSVTPEEVRIRQRDNNLGKHRKGEKRNPAHVKAAADARNINRGPTHTTPHSEETKRILSEKNKGKILSDETRAKMSAAKKGKKQSPGVIAKKTGQKRTPEQRQRMSEAKRKRDEERRINKEITSD